MRLLSKQAQTSLLVAVCCLFCPSPANALEEWKSLFNGEDLSGWIQRGGKARYYVEDGAIVGETVPRTPNAFLCTEQFYGDFILELEFKVAPGMNSGIQVRSNSFRNYRNGTVHGYQVEIDTSERSWSGGIYEESVRGWLFPLKDLEKARKAFRNGQWNHYRIQAIGDSIKTWVNGVPATDLVDHRTQLGFIALQIHSTRSEEPLRIQWRNIRIRNLGRHGWKPLFNGQNLDNWTALPGGKWEVRDGVIVGTSPVNESRHGQLITNQRYKDFTARFKFRSIKGNSGFYFRVDKVKHPVAVNGFQAEIEPGFETGGLYETGGRGWVVKSDPKELKKHYKPGEWNGMTVSARGGRIAVTVNGMKTVELRDDPGRAEGHIALQLHGGNEMHVEFRDLEILVPVDVEPKPVGASWLLGPDLDLSAWKQGEKAGDSIEWTRHNNQGYIQIKPGTGSLTTAENVRDFQLHLEFNTPENLEKGWGNNGNSGIYIQRRYEVQIINSFGRKVTYQDCGAIYKAYPPLVNVCRPAGHWNTYDLVFRAARWSGDRKTENARITVYLNDTLVQDDVDIPGKTGAGQPESPLVAPILLQDHGAVVKFRNVWIRSLNLDGMKTTDFSKALVIGK